MIKTAPLICMVMLGGGQQMLATQNQTLESFNIASTIYCSKQSEAKSLFLRSEANSKLTEERKLLDTKPNCIDNSGIHVAYYINGDKMNYMMIDEIPYEDKVLVLKDKTLLNYGIEDGYYYLTNDDLGISCYGKSYEELYEDVKDNISANWEMYVDCDINELSADAVDLRNKLLNNLELRS